MPRRLWTAAVAIALVLATPVPSAFSSGMCLTWVRKPRELKAAFDLVAVATVQQVADSEPLGEEQARSIDPFWPPSHAQVLKLQVTAVWKGPRDKILVVTRDASGVRDSFVPQFVVGDEYLLFAKSVGGVWWIGTCNPSGPVASVRERLRDFGRPKWKP